MLAAPTAERQVVRQRDPQAFQAYITTYMDTWSRSDQIDHSEQDLRWVTDHPQDALALGDGACAWLRTLPDAPEVDPSGATSWGARYDEAMRETDLGATTNLSAEGKYVVVAASWSYLCWWDRVDKTAPESVSEYED